MEGAVKPDSGGAAKSDAIFDNLINRLEAVNIKQVEKQVKKAEVVMPAATAKQAAGNSSA
ncbi:hypothetical protein [uncultured Roseobacter sp.]|uniref:hypothetical protein n=1 Tax=uncultured Roseobacter sp. TaxID=114847 RepID=UPI0026094D15|nr:hypothetical protein [uncultured Roseobacter sp.]